ncbi:hypothetical protein Tco_0252699 [Tanacetum coccineum]
MLNKDNYVLWSSRLLRYAKSRPNGKLIYNSIMNGPYVIRMIPEPGDPDCEVPINETFHEQTDEELTEKELKQVEGDDQAIQTILLGLPEDIYAANPNGNGNVVAARDERNANGNNDGSAEVHHLENCYDNDIFNMFTQEEQYTELLEPILEPHQVQHNDSNVISKVSCVEQDGGTVEQHPATVEETHAYFESLYNNLAIEVEKVNTVNRKLRETNADLTTELARYKNQEKCFEISQEKYDKLERCYQKSVYQEQFLTKKINALHLSSEAAKFVRDFKPLAKETDESFAKHKALELEIERLLRAVAELERMKERFENCIIKKENEYAKLWNDWYTKCEECKYDKISYDAAYNDMQQNIKQLQAQLGDLKGKCKDTPCVSDTLDPLSQKLKNENVELEFQVSEQKDITKGMSVNTQFKKQSILGKPPSSSGSKLYSVTPFPKSKGLPKIDETHALSNPVTSNSVPTTTESKVVTKDKVIAPRMFRINSFKTSREDKFVLINKFRASVRTKMINVSQPYVLTKKVVNSNSNGLSSIGVDNTTKTRRPQPRSNTKNDRVPSALTVVAARIKKLM